MDRSEEVRDFYERMPYPAPLTSLDEHRDLYKNRDRRRAEFHLIWPAKQPRENQEILIAGCGTSQAARYALREPDARITAIDVSDTSLRHTRDLQRKYNLENLELHQLPIERVREIGRSFDLVVCTGVLHHLPDPDYGLRALRDVLRPSGAMRLMVYARYGRQFPAPHNCCVGAAVAGASGGTGAIAGRPTGIRQRGWWGAAEPSGK